MNQELRPAAQAAKGTFLRHYVRTPVVTEPSKILLSSAIRHLTVDPVPEDGESALWEMFLGNPPQLMLLDDIASGKRSPVAPYDIVGPSGLEGDADVGVDDMGDAGRGANLCRARMSG